MIKRLITLVAPIVAALAMATGALAATTAPHSFTGYHATGPISIQGENQCLTATNLGHDRWVLSIFQCDGDPSQLWHSIAINGVVKIALAGHQNIVISGLPGVREVVELLNTEDFPEGLIPFNRSTYISGPLKRAGVNKLSNTYRQRFAAPQRGRSLVWTGYFLPLSAKRGLIFGGTGWIAETVT